MNQSQYQTQSNLRREVVNIKIVKIFITKHIGSMDNGTTQETSQIWLFRACQTSGFGSQTFEISLCVQTEYLRGFQTSEMPVSDVWRSFRRLNQGSDVWNFPLENSQETQLTSRRLWLCSDAWNRISRRLNRGSNVWNFPLENSHFVQRVSDVWNA